MINIIVLINVKVKSKRDQISGYLILGNSLLNVDKFNCETIK